MPNSKGLITVSLEGIDSVSLDLERTTRGLASPEPLMRAISETLYDVTMENFEREGQPGWEALRPATIRERSKHGYWPGKKLQRSGVLKAAVHPFATRNEAIISVALPYAAIQQLGGTVNVEAKSGSVRLRETAGGQLLRQGKEGRKKNLARFAKATHKRARDVAFSASAHSITIPARPYLPVTPGGDLQAEAEAGILADVHAWLQGLWDG